MCRGRGTPGNRTTGNGNSGRSESPRTLSLASLIMEPDYGRAAGRSQLRTEKTWPRAVLGNVAGPSSTPFVEEGFMNGVWTDAKREWTSGSFKECVRTTPTYESGSTCKCWQSGPG